MILLIDIGNTHTHLGLGNDLGVTKTLDFPTSHFERGTSAPFLRKLLGRRDPDGISICSVVPEATPQLLRMVSAPTLVLTPKTVRGIGINYPKPSTIGPDRLANAVAVRRHHGAPALVVDFGTAVTFDVVDRHGDYAGGVIAPGLSAMTEYLHEKTALLPAIRIRDTRAVIGKNTEEAMLIGAVHGYRGLVRELVGQLKRELRARRLPVIATGGYASLIARALPEITKVEEHLTLEGLRLVWFDDQRHRNREK